MGKESYKIKRVRTGKKYALALYKESFDGWHLKAVLLKGVARDYARAAGITRVEELQKKFRQDVVFEG